MLKTLLFPTETIRIPKLAPLNVECEWVEPYPWLCQLLREHVVEGAGQVMGHTVPSLVLKYISYTQKTISKFVSPDMRLLTNLTADIAGILTAYEDLNTTPDYRELTTLPEATFTVDEYSRLQRWLRDIPLVIEKYDILLEKLQEQHKMYQKLSKNVQAAERRLNAYRRKHAHSMDPYGTITGKRGAKLEELNNSYAKTYETLVHTFARFRKTGAAAVTLKKRMFRIASFVKFTVVEAVADQIYHALDRLARVIESPAIGNVSLQRRLSDRLQEINPLRLGEEIYYYTSTTYTCPDLENLRVSAALDESILKGKWNKTIPRRKEGDRQAMVDKYILLPKTNSNTHCALPVFFKRQKDLKVKQKFTLMNGEIGFGWSRKSVFRPRKTWGLFPIVGARSPSTTSTGDSSKASTGDLSTVSSDDFTTVSTYDSSTTSTGGRRKKVVFYIGSDSSSLHIPPIE